MTGAIVSLLLAGATAQATDSPAALDALLLQLARPAPTATAFAEQRESALLSEPLLLRGMLRQPDADTLVREVESPYVERSTIRAERVVVERADGSSRRFGLRNAPELAALLDSFRAMLGGDRSLLERHYRTELLGQADANWQLDLVPRNVRQQRRIAMLRLFGQGHELACMQIVQGDGGSSHMLLGEAATATADDALDAALAANCREIAVE
jgi:hypothetical protein